MNEWLEVSLGDIVENKSRRFDFSKHQEVVFINTGDVLEGKFLKYELVTKAGLPGQAKKAIRKGDILFSEIRPANKRFAKVDFEASNYVVSTKFMVLSRIKQDVDLDFLYLVLTGNQYLIELQRIAESRSGTFPQITFDAISYLPINLPPLPEQKAIAHILGKLDDKIELNRQMNQTLEAMAQALFKSWFVDFDPVLDNALAAGNPIPEALQAMAEKRLQKFPSLQGGVSATGGRGGQAEAQSNAPKGQVGQTELQSIPPTGGRGGQAEHPKKANPSLEQTRPLLQSNPKLAAQFPNSFSYNETLGKWIPEGWEVKSLDEIAHYQNGLALQKFRPENDDDDFLPVLKISHLKEGNTDGKEKARTDIKESCRVENGDIIFSWSASLMVDIWCGGKAALNQHLFKVTSEKFPKWFFYLFTKHHLDEFIRIAADKAVTMGHIKREHLSEAKCAFMNEAMLNVISSHFENLLNKQIENRLETETLTQLRDTLLPQLISGKLRVPVDLVNQVEHLVQNPLA